MQRFESAIRDVVQSMKLGLELRDGNMPLSLTDQQGDRLYIWNEEASELVVMDLLHRQQAPASLEKRVIPVHRTVQFPVRQLHINVTGSLAALVSEQDIQVFDLSVRGPSECKELNIITSGEGVVQARWHPFSPRALFVLSYRALECYQFPDLDEPEIRLTLPSIAAPEKEVVAFCFGTGDGWERLCVYVLHADTTISSFCPVIPANSLLGRQYLEQLRDAEATAADGGMAAWVNRIIDLGAAHTPALQAGAAEDEDQVLRVSVPRPDHPTCIGPYTQLPKSHAFEDDAVCIESAAAGDYELLFTLTKEGKVYIQLLAEPAVPQWTTDSEYVPDVFTLEVVDLQLPSSTGTYALAYVEQYCSVVVWHSFGIHIVNLKPYYDKILLSELSDLETIKSDIHPLLQHEQSDSRQLVGHSVWVRASGINTVLLHSVDSGRACDVAIRPLRLLVAAPVPASSHPAFGVSNEMSKVWRQDDEMMSEFANLRVPTLPKPPKTVEATALLVHKVITTVHASVLPTIEKSKAVLQKRRAFNDALLAKLKRYVQAQRERLESVLAEQERLHKNMTLLALQMDLHVDRAEVIFHDLNARTPALSDEERAMKKRLEQLNATSKTLWRHVDQLKQRAHRARGRRGRHHTAQSVIDPTQLAQYQHRLNDQHDRIEDLKEKVDSMRASLSLD
ncbi:hypothetical protein PTSG_09504 [Salpingoeca rosetta]|uniref:Nucleoporin Nup88 n=1 Tax=Salpingoeca rosetta (strain ATCC 50818 / BSB-021) TaxID=946362 RepID=F2UL71_SALR5|nr:uncharacterized protein PTSG_09504 [Salpingoeca rosetta]EGD77870.1 hypothetical protein PTSG_09504 [Salpingoeca rosetta]|eukprot:XP_004989934.1 hypothetical protein PTSG_09504 [Salpingoeca rosetta]